MTVIKDNIVIPDRKTVEDWKSIEPLAGDRKLTPARVKELKRRFHDGQYIGGDICFTITNGIKERVNGKHTLEFYSSLNDDELKTIKVRVREITCNSNQEKYAVYDAFDARMSVRSGKDLAKAAASQINEKFSLVPEWVTERVVNALGYIEAKYQSPYNNKNRRYLLFDNQDFLTWVFETFKKNDSYEEAKDTVLTASPSFAVARTYFADKHTAAQYWQGVMIGHHDPNHVFAKARNQILNYKQDCSKIGTKAYSAPVIDELLELFDEYRDSLGLIKSDEDRLVKGQDVVNLPGLVT